MSGRCLSENSLTTFFPSDFLQNSGVSCQISGRWPSKSQGGECTAHLCVYFLTIISTYLIAPAQASVANSICKTITAFDTSTSLSSQEGLRYKPDIIFYGANIGDIEDPLASFQKMEMFVEFKRGNDSDPFHSHDQLPFEKLFEDTCGTRGQVILYSTRLQTYQFRTWVFSVGIFGKVARLFRWDRAGAIVSEPIPYCERGNRDLTEFFYRFDLVNHVLRGFDPTVFDATPEEAAAFEGVIEAVIEGGKNSLLKGLFRSVGSKDKYPRRRVEIPAGGNKRVVSYIVGRPMANTKSPTGRATRCFVAMSKDTGNLVFFKDTWRPNIEGVKGEAHWFGRARGVRNISAFLHGSEVRCVAVRRGAAETSDPPTNPVQRTLTDPHSGDYNGPQRMMGYIHCRTVQCEFYIPLNMFKDSKHLVEIMLDIVIGMSLHFCVTPTVQFPSAIQDLYDRGILHRDISVPNIMIAVDGSGRLIDLDMARDREDIGPWLIIRTVGPHP